MKKLMMLLSIGGLFGSLLNGCDANEEGIVDATVFGWEVDVANEYVDWTWWTQSEDQDVDGGFYPEYKIMAETSTLVRDDGMVEKTIYYHLQCGEIKGSWVCNFFDANTGDIISDDYECFAVSPSITEELAAMKNEGDRTVWGVTIVVPTDMEVVFMFGQQTVPTDDGYDLTTLEINHIDDLTINILEKMGDIANLQMCVTRL